MNDIAKSNQQKSRSGRHSRDVSRDSLPHFQPYSQGSMSNADYTFASVEPVVVQVVKHVKGTMNHSYRDFSLVAPNPNDNARNNNSRNIDDMTFAQKVHDMLQDASYSDCIAWMPHGRAFKVFNPAVFEKTACKRYFGHSRYSSFLRQLNNHGFKHISRGTDRNCMFSTLLGVACSLCRVLRVYSL